MQINNALQKLINQLPDAVLDEMRPVWGNSQVGSIKAAILEGRKALDETTEESVNDALLQSLKAYRSAQRRILEKWSEGDHHVKADLWRDLHHCEDAATAAIEVAENWVVLEANGRVNISDPIIHSFVRAAEFAMRLLSQNADDALAQSCISELAKAISNVTVYGTGPMIQERPRGDEGISTEMLAINLRTPRHLNTSIRATDEFLNLLKPAQMGSTSPGILTANDQPIEPGHLNISKQGIVEFFNSLQPEREATAAQSELFEEQFRSTLLENEIRSLNSFLKGKGLLDEFEQWLVDQGIARILSDNPMARNNGTPNTFMGFPLKQAEMPPGQWRFENDEF